MEYIDIKKLINDMNASNLTTLAIDFPDGTKISMQKESTQKGMMQNENQMKEVLEDRKEENAKREEKENKEEEEMKQPQGYIVKSPMVGTFYRKSSPSAPAYVEIGKQVKQGDVLCIIEAMKLMNEIEAEVAGEIVDIYVKDGEAVEYGKPLFCIR